MLETKQTACNNKALFKILLQQKQKCAKGECSGEALKSQKGWGGSVGYDKKFSEIFFWRNVQKQQFVI